MNRAYWLVPCLGMTAFAAYYLQWEPEPPTTPLVACTDWSSRIAAMEAAAQIAGARDAENDLRDGRLVILTYGLHAPVNFTRSDIGEKYGLESRAAAGCILHPWDSAYIESYNALMEPAITRIHGLDSLEKIKARVFSGR